MYNSEFITYAIFMFLIVDETKENYKIWYNQKHFDAVKNFYKDIFNIDYVFDKSKLKKLEESSDFFSSENFRDIKERFEKDFAKPYYFLIDKKDVKKFEKDILKYEGKGDLRKLLYYYGEFIEHKKSVNLEYKKVEDDETFEYISLLNVLDREIDLFLKIDPTFSKNEQFFINEREIIKKYIKPLKPFGTLMGLVR